MNNKKYMTPEFSFVAIQTSDIMTTSPTGHDSEDNWYVDPFATR